MHVLLKKTYLILCCIVLIAGLFRFIALGSNPPFLNWDEVAWGYNAYALGLNARDEFGRFLPYTYLESFGDYKPPVYAYLTVLPVKIFGLNAFATRFASALCGTLTVLITYFLVKRLFPKSKNKNWYGLAAAGVLAISPWHIMLSRAAFEANVATFLMVTGVWLFLGGMQEKKWYLVLSAIPFALSFYTFNTPRVVVPLLVVFLALFFWREILTRKKQIIIAAMLGILFLLPTVKFLLSPQAKLRFDEVNIFTDVSVVERGNQEVANDGGGAVSKLIHNRRLLFTADFLKHYFDNLSPSFLFITGDGNPKFSIQDVGQMYLWDLPFFILGIFLLFKKREGYWWVIPLWLIIGIVPAATAQQTPHALRTEITLPTFQIFVAYGIVSAFVFLQEKVKKQFTKNTIIFLVSFLLLCNVFYFVYNYATYYPYRFSGDWNFTYKDSIQYVSQNEAKYNKIVVSDVLGRPYIYYLFYMHISPITYRQTANVSRDVFGFVTVNSFGKYIFSDNPSSIKGNTYLYIDNIATAPKNVHVLQIFKNLDGTPVLEAYTM